MCGCCWRDAFYLMSIFSKKENHWYQQEIDIASRDNAEYISYLESKKEEKLVAIQKLADGNKRDQELFMEQKKKYKQEYEARIAGLLLIQHIINKYLLSYTNRTTRYHRRTRSKTKRKGRRVPSAL